MTAPRTILLVFGFVVVGHLDAADRRRPLVVAHRGLLLHAPENTLANFRACLELRIGFEFDVQRTKDGHLVCVHDSTVDRTTNGTGKVTEMTLTEIRRLDAGRWYDPRFAGEKVPTIEDVLKLVAAYEQHDILLAADLKSENVEEDVVKLAKQHGVLDRLLFIGRTIAKPDVRERIEAASSDAHSAAVANDADEFRAALMAPNADWLYLRYLPTREQVKAVHRAGKQAFVAGPTVAGDLPENWRRAAEVGVDGILTDHALGLATVLRKAESSEEQ